MKNQFKWLTLLALMLFNAVAAIAGNAQPVHQSTRIRHQGKIVAITVDTRDGRNAPLEELVAAIKHYPKSSSFKISWNVAVLGGAYKGVAIYNRSRKTVTLYAFETWEERIERYHIIYSSVSETILGKIARLHEISTEDDNGPDVLGFFYELPKYGCKEQKLD